MRKLVLFVLLMVSAGVAHAATLDAINYGFFLEQESYGVGQSFLVHGTGSYNHIAFNFYTGPFFQLAPNLPPYTDLNQLTPYAYGTAYLLTGEYKGLNSALNATTPGVIGTAVAANNQYSFDSSLVLNAGTLYFLYTNTYLPAWTLANFALNIPDQGYDSSFPNYGYQNDERSFDFLATGTSLTATPEPSSLLLLGSGCLGGLAALRRRAPQR